MDSEIAPCDLSGQTQVTWEFSEEDVASPLDDDPALTPLDPPHPVDTDKVAAPPGPRPAVATGGIVKSGQTYTHKPLGYRRDNFVSNSQSGGSAQRHTARPPFQPAFSKLRARPHFVSPRHGTYPQRDAAGPGHHGSVPLEDQLRRVFDEFADIVDKRLAEVVRTLDERNASQDTVLERITSILDLLQQKSEQCEARANRPHHGRDWRDNEFPYMPNSLERFHTQDRHSHFDGGRWPNHRQANFQDHRDAHLHHRRNYFHPYNNNINNTHCGEFHGRGRYATGYGYQDNAHESGSSSAGFPHQNHVYPPSPSPSPPRLERRIYERCAPCPEAPSPSDQGVWSTRARDGAYGPPPRNFSAPPRAVGTWDRPDARPPLVPQPDHSKPTLQARIGNPRAYVRYLSSSQPAPV